MISAIQLRNLALRKVRDYFTRINVKEVITSLFVDSAAIEPYLQSFEIQELKKFLPTSPEFGLKKTLALEPPEVVGIYEIAHSFRKELPSKLHSYEFTMLEFYLRNFDYLSLADHLKQIISNLCEIKKELNLKVKSEFKILEF